MFSVAALQTLGAMKTHLSANTSDVDALTSRRSGLPALLAACGFVAFYLVTDLVTPLFASTSLPLPNDPVSQVRAWFIDNQLAAVLMGAGQSMSVLFLGAFTLALGVRRVRRWGFLAVGLMLASSGCAWVLAGVAASASLDTVEGLRTASFVLGGTAHVLALGVFVFVASRADGFGRPLRVLAVVALVACGLSLSSLLIFQGALFILVGRLLCMAWAIGAGVSLLRRPRRTSS